MALGFERTPEAAGPLVRGFSGGQFTVGDDSYTAVMLTPEKASDWTAPALADLTPDAFGPLIALDPAPEFILLGTGASHLFTPRALVRALEEKGIGLETMDSRAAARTWGLLRAEDRWIAAALMPL